MERVPLKENSIISGENGQSYTVLRLLSDRGGSGLTYYAKYSESGRLVVLKEFFPKQLARKGLKRGSDGASLDADGLSEPDREQLEQLAGLFCSETRRMLALQRQVGSRLAPGSESQLAPEFAFFVSEPFGANRSWYIELSTGEGESLSGYKFHSLAESLKLLKKLCCAVSELHGLGQIHLDLKPDNVFVTASGEIRLLDFGSMRGQDEGQTLIYAYSEGFSAPELNPIRWLIKESATVRSDVYSLAAILHWMIFKEGITSEQMINGFTGSLATLYKQDFSDLLRGYSLELIGKVFAVLRKGLRFEPSDRYLNIGELCDALEEIEQLLDCEEKAPDPIGDADEFIRRIGDLYDYQRCGSDPKLMHIYYEKRIAPAMDDVKEAAPGACLGAIRRRLFNKGITAKALFCLRFLENNAPLEQWDLRTDGTVLYQLIANCLIKCGDIRLMQEYEKKLQTQRYPIADQIRKLFDDDFRSVGRHEDRMDFDAMVNDKRRFIEEIWGQQDALSFILKERDMEKGLIQEAGQLAEALCLQRAEGWDKQARAIWEHSLDHHYQAAEPTFLDRTVDNLLHFAIEINDEALFRETLPNLSDRHTLYGYSSDDLDNWLTTVVRRFRGELPEGRGYELYLFLKCVNRLFSDQLSEPAVEALRDLSVQIRLTHIPFHPRTLILKYLILLDVRTGSRSSERRHRMALKKMVTDARGSDNPLSIVRLIADAALLAVHEESAVWLMEDIRAGVEADVFCKDYFEDVPEYPSVQLLLSKFRFKHS